MPYAARHRSLELAYTWIMSMEDMLGGCSAATATFDLLDGLRIMIRLSDSLITFEILQPEQ